LKEYHIYYIKDEFADHYYFKCDLLFRFIQAYHEEKDRPDLASQFNYITNKFPEDLIQAIKSKLKRTSSYFVDNESPNCLKIQSGNRQLILFIYKEEMIMQCDSLHDAEVILFPSLRGVYPCLFIIGPLVNEYGWISPEINKFPSLEKEEVLYSYL